LTKCQKLKLPGKDGKTYPGDTADAETLFRIIQSIPSPKAEPFKRWFAQVAYEHLKQGGSVATDRAIGEYRAIGWPEEWIDLRVQAISSRNDITDEWENSKVKGKSFGHITNALSETALGVTPKEHLALKGLPVKPTCATR
jgi:DNA-damage-inducible protein D